MQTKKYAPLILALLAAAMAIVHIVDYVRIGDWGGKWYLLLAGLLFAGAAISSFMKNSDMKLGWYLYIGSFAFWILTQIFTNLSIGGLLSVLPGVLVGLFIIFYLLDDEVIASFSYEFSLNK